MFTENILDMFPEVKTKTNKQKKTNKKKNCDMTSLAKLLMK